MTSTIDVFSGQQKIGHGHSGSHSQQSRTRTGSGNGVQRLNSLREEHRPAPSPKRPFFKRNHATDDPRVAGELADTQAKASSHKVPIMGPRPLSLHGSVKAQVGITATGMNDPYIEYLDGTQPHSAPPVATNFPLANVETDTGRDIGLPDSPTPTSRRAVPPARNRLGLPILPEIQRQAFFIEQRPTSIQIDVDPVPMLSPGLPDDQYLNIFLKANPDENPELDSFLRTAAFHVAAFRQFGAPLPHWPSSSGVGRIGLEAQQQEVLRDRSTEQFYSPILDSTEEYREEMDYHRNADPETPLADSVDFASDLRRVSASTADTVFADAVEDVEVLEDEATTGTSHLDPAPVMKKKKSFIRRRSYMSGAESVDNQDETPRKRSRSAFDRALDFGSRKNGK